MTQTLEGRSTREDLGLEGFFWGAYIVITNGLGRGFRLRVSGFLVIIITSPMGLIGFRVQGPK